MLSVLLMLLPAHATDYHVCDCASGADADCVAGADASAGSPASPLQTLSAGMALFNHTMVAGDRLLMCEGGVFDAAAGLWYNDACTAADPCEVTSYTPSWASGDEGRPVVRAEGTAGFEVVSPGSASQQEGLTLSGFDLVCEGCAGTGAFGIFLYNDIDHVLVEDLHISGFDIGIHLGATNGCDGSTADCDGHNTDITVRDCIIEKNHVLGMLGGGTRLSVLDSTFSENGSGSHFEHNLYLNGPTGTATDVLVQGNTLYRSAWASTGQCEGASLVVHGLLTDLQIVDNLVYEDVGGAGPGCWGITVDAAYSDSERFERVLIARNRVHNVGNVGIGVSSCIDCVVENNVVTNHQAFDSFGVLAPSRFLSAEDPAMSGLIVRNNSVAVASGVGLGLPEQTDGSVVVSNALWVGSGSCFETPADPTEGFDTIDHNVCLADLWTTAGLALEDWQSVGWGGSSLAENPGFTDPPAGDLTPANPAGPLADAGHRTLSATVDHSGAPRDSAPDVGAFEVVPPTVDDTGTDTPEDSGVPEPAGDSAGDWVCGTTDDDADKSGCSVTGTLWGVGWLVGLGLVGARRRD